MWWAFSGEPGYDPAKIKEILDISEKSVAIESRLVALAAWMKESYGGTMIQALKTVLPIKRKERERRRQTLVLRCSRAEAEEKLAWYERKNQKARARLLRALIESPRADYGLICGKLQITRPVVRALEEAGLVSLVSDRVYRNPVRPRQAEESCITYTQPQQEAVQKFAEDYGRGLRRTYLVYGVTGSGKTEVYMAMIRKVVETGRQAGHAHTGESALTWQTVLRFQRMFGDRVSILNSRMSAGERYDQMQRAKKGEIDVMIGPRSALFTPFPRLGLIVIDEEHESSYKSEQVPRYHARETAGERARLEGGRPRARVGHPVPGGLQPLQKGGSTCSLRFPPGPGAARCQKSTWKICEESLGAGTGPS